VLTHSVFIVYLNLYKKHKKNLVIIFIMYYIFLGIPALIYVLIFLYNYKSPEFFGMPFFYWFQIFMLIITSIFYALAVFLGKDDG